MAEKPKVTIAIPSYNHGAFIEDAIKSCLWQEYGDVEILIVDNGSTDRTMRILSGIPPSLTMSGKVRIFQNTENIGLHKNLNKCIELAKGEYLVLLCSDDKFTNPHVISDIVKIFELCPNVAVVDRPYYQYMDGYPGAVVEVRESHVLMSVINPSGVAIRRTKAGIISDKIYAEFPTMVKGMLHNSDYKRLSYDSVAVRIHKNNLATKKSYYKGSAAKNLSELLGKDFKTDFRSGYIALKNRVGNAGVSREILETIKVNPMVIFNPFMWFWACFAFIIPACILRKLSDFYRHRIGRMLSRIIHRQHGPVILNLGAGKRGRKDTINVDVMPNPGIDIVTDLSKPWPWEDSSVDGIYAHHVIEHLPSQEAFIKECLRVLKPGGFLYLAVPHSSCVTSIGCMGHNRTYSYSTLNDYLARDFYMFGKAKWKTVYQKLNWWYETISEDVPWYFRIFIVPLNRAINFLISLSPRFFENGWCYWVGGAREVIWKGEKL